MTIVNSAGINLLKKEMRFISAFAQLIAIGGYVLLVTRTSKICFNGKLSLKTMQVYQDNIRHLGFDGIKKAGTFYYKMTANYSKQFIKGTLSGIGRSLIGGKVAQKGAESFLNLVS